MVHNSCRFGGASLKGKAHSQHDDHLRDHCKRGFQLSPYTCGDDYSLICGNEPQTGYHKFPRNDYYYGNRAYNAALHHAHQRGDYKHLVRKRVEELSESGYKITAAGDVSVQRVWGGASRKYRKSNNRTERYNVSQHKEHVERYEYYS